MRQTLGLAADADEATIVAAMGEALTERADPQPVAAKTGDVTVPDGKMLVDTDQWKDVVAAAQLGAKAHAVQAAADRDKTIDTAWRDGKISAKAKTDWATRWDKQGAEATAADLADLPVVFPVVKASGYAGHDGSAGESVVFSDEQAAKVAAQLGISKEALLA